MAEERVLNFKIKTDDTSLEGTRKRIEDLKSEMLKATDEQTFNKLALEAGELETEIRRVEDAVTSLAGSGSELTKMSQSFNRVGASLLSMDFAAASEEAGRLASISKSMNFGSAISSVKQLSSTFIQMGKALLTNPFFLLVGVIVAIGVAIYKLLDELGILTMIFEAVGDAIGFVIQKLKDLLDWLGITSYAEDEAAEKSANASEKRRKANKRANDAIVSDMERTLEKMELEGASIEEIEAKEIELAKTRLKNFQQETRYELKRIKLLEAQGKATDEDLDRKAEINETLKQLTHELDVTEMKVADSKEEREEQARQKSIDAYKKQKEKQAEIERNSQQVLDKIQKEQEDRDIEMIEDEVERFEKKELLKLERQKESMDFEKMTLEAQLVFQQHYEDRKTQIQNEAIQKRKEQRDEDFKLEKEKFNALYDEYEKYTSSVRELEEQDVQDGFKEDIDKYKEWLDAKIITDEEYHELEKERKLQREQELLDIQNEYREKDLEAEIEAINKKGSERQKYIDFASSMAENLFTITNALGKKDEESEEKRAKRQFLIKKGLNLASAINSAATSIPAYLAENPLLVGGIPNPGAIAGFAQLVATNAASIASIASSKFDQKSMKTPSTGGGGGGGSSASMGQRPTDSTPSMNINNGQDANAGGSQQRNVVSVVDYTDIADKEKEVKGLKKRVSLQ